MAKIIDITDKLSFDSNPMLKIKDETFEVNADARTMLEIMGSFANKSEAEATIESYEKLFSERERERLDRMKLPFKDFKQIVEEAMKLVSGEDEQLGEK